MSNADQLRARLPRVSTEMAEAIERGLHEIRKAIDATDETADPRTQGWLKGMQDALMLLRPARDANDQFRIWLSEVMLQEVDLVGATAEERKQIEERAAAADARMGRR